MQGETQVRDRLRQAALAAPSQPAVDDVRGRVQRQRRAAGVRASVAVVAFAVLTAAVPVLLSQRGAEVELGPASPGGEGPPDQLAADADLTPLEALTGTMLVATDDHQVTFVDIDAGETHERELRELAPGDPPHRLVAGERLVLYGGASVYAMDPHPDAEVERIAGSSDFAVFAPSGRDDRVWLRPGRIDGEPADISQIDVDGEVTRGPAESPGGNLTVGLADYVVLQDGDGMRVWDPEADEIVIEVDGVFPMGSDGERFAWCRSAARGRDCQDVHLTDPERGETELVATAPEGTHFAGYRGEVSPDGRYLAAPLCDDAESCGLSVIALDTGQTWTVADALVSRAGLAWSPDGRWVFAPLTTDAVAAYRPGDAEARAVPVELPARRALGFGAVAAPDES